MQYFLPKRKVNDLFVNTWRLLLLRFSRSENKADFRKRFLTSFGLLLTASFRRVYYDGYKRFCKNEHLHNSEFSKFFNVLDQLFCESFYVYEKLFRISFIKIAYF